MATERVTERSDGVTAERTTERTDGTVATVDRGGTGRTLIIVAALVILAILAFVFLRPLMASEQAENNAVAGAAESVEGAAQSVGDAAQQAADAVTPE